MGQPVIALEVDGVVKDPAQKANRLFQYYMRSYASQSTLYQGAVLSYYLDSRTSGMDPTAMVNKVKNSLETLFSPHFDQINISVRAVRKPNNPDYVIAISGKVIEGKVSYELSREINMNSDTINQEIGDNQ